MLSKKFKTILCIVMLTQAFLINSAFAKESRTWSYVGRTGPDHWSKLDKEFALCQEGEYQTPINLDTKNLVSNKEPLVFHYEPYKVAATDYSSKPSKYLEIAGKSYKLIQFHFHAPSEHSMNNIIYPAELHFVHQDKDGNLAVIGVMIKEGKSSQLIQDIVNNANKNSEEKHSVADNSLMELLPENKEYFHYMGSLTTPPCTEGVNWYVLKTPIEASKEEIEALDKAMPDNARPIQKDNGRIAK